MYRSANILIPKVLIVGNKIIVTIVSNISNKSIILPPGKMSDFCHTQIVT
jgi:hypothetical protein